MRAASRPVARLAASFAATLGLTVATVMWSESVFWGRWRPGDSVENLLWTIAGYGAIVQVVRFVAARTSVATAGRGAWRRVFLAGALFGWLVEGVLVTTVVDELPLTLSHTGLSWHAIVTVLLAWWAIPRLLERRTGVSLAVLAAIGACVGAWASFWRFEDGDVTPVLEYAAYVTLLTVGYAGGLALWWWMRDRATPGIRGTALAALALLGIAILNAIDRPITLIGPLLVGIAVLALVTTRPRQHLDPPPVLLPTGGPAPYAALWRLAIVPVAAIAVFAGFAATPEPIPTGWPFFAAGVIGGTILFVVAWVGGVRNRATPPADPTEARSR